MKVNKIHIAIGLAVVLVILFILHLILMTAEIDSPEYWELSQLFNMDNEMSIPTWYSTVILLFVPALLLFYIGLIKHQAGDKMPKYWFMVGGLFLFLSIDDGAMIHEKISTINRLTGLQDVLNGFNAELLSWSWWVIYLPIGIALAVLLARWFWSLPNRTKLMVGGALLLVLIGQVAIEAYSSLVTNSTGEYVGPVWRGVEKLLGRGGLSLFLLAVIDYISNLPAKTRHLAVKFSE
jgi:hypothetical protein